MPPVAARMDRSTLPHRLALVSRSPVSPASFLSDPLFLTCLCPSWCARPGCVEASRACARYARASCCTGYRNRVVVHPRERPGGPCPEPPLAALVGPLLQTFFWPRGTLDAHPRQANATRRPYIIYQGDPSPRWPWMTKSSSPARGRARYCAHSPGLERRGSGSCGRID